MKLPDRVALVTGGGRGIGRAIALAFAREGADVAVTARTGAELDAVAAEIRALGRQALAVPCDVGERAQVDDAVRRVGEGLGPIQILVNNAGIAVSAKLLDTDDALWERHLRVNLTGAFLMTRAALPGMLAARWGRDHQRRVDRGPPGVPARRRLLGLQARPHRTDPRARPGGRDDRRDRQRDLPRVRGDRDDVAGARNIQKRTGRAYEEAVQALAAFSPQKRLIEPDEVAALAVLLASDEARGVTAQAWNVDGGAVQA